LAGCEPAYLGIGKLLSATEVVMGLILGEGLHRSISLHTVFSYFDFA